MKRFENWYRRAGKTLAVVFGLTFGLMTPALEGQSGGGQTQNPPAASSQPAQDIPDAPSTVQPPVAKPALPPALPDSDKIGQDGPAPSSTNDSSQPEPAKETPPSVPQVQTRPARQAPRNQINPADDLYKISVPVNFVRLPVMVRDSEGRRVDGLLPKDFTVLENGKKQVLTYFTSDPYELSVAILLDTGMPDVVLQKVNQTYSALVGAFSPYDEVALYTYSSTVSQVSDFTGRNDRLAAVLNQMKLVRGRNNGPAVLSGPLAQGPPIVNGAPVGGPIIAPVNTPPREAHVLNDAILRAALDLSKRDADRRKVIMVISDGRDLGSQASYRDVLKVLETHGIQVKAVVLDSGALPVFRQAEKLHLPGQGHNDILPKYCSATGGGQVFDELSRNTMEEAYAQITSEARNQYTLGYAPKATTGSSAYRSIEVLVARRGLKVFSRDGYYPTPSAR